ncbi:AAA family ATPase [Salimicrobium humidisoli]|uniref:Nuclease SbcCD subunit C n=1 Tax=Salimicrobium humidisoli TaxID=2029857 RepID=A0ABX4HVT7_9BACI|nr:AAA family ATPase [Salimicrobium humidisoli]PBB06947.1 DNA sulfur modification protein DndD [Salimicrobium humidisoli]
MKIESLTMKNFRQYYGRQTIDFAQGENQEVVTVILGENGRGKTGIYRAMLFALFGDEKLNQDTDEASLNLVNLKAIKESNDNVEAEVTLTFSHNSQQYVISRKLVGGLINDKVTEQRAGQKLKGITSGEEWIGEEDISLQIQQFIDERVKNYFFFDGERIERLTRVSHQQRKEISTGIKNLLKIDDVFKTEAVLKEVKSKANAELSKYSSGEYKKALHELEKREKEYADLLLEKENNEEYSSTMENELNNVNQKLSEFESMSALLNSRDQLEQEVKKAEAKIEEKTMQLRVFNDYLPLMMGEDTLELVQAKLKKELENQDFSGISSSFVQQLVSDMQCICGTDLSKNQEQLQELKSLEASVKEYEENKTSHELLEALNSLFDFLSGRKDVIELQLTDINQMSYEKEENQVKLEKLNNRLSDSAEGEMQHLNDKRKELHRKIDEAENQRERLQSQLTSLTETIKNGKSHLKELEKRSGVRSKLLEKNDLLDRSLQTMSGLIATFEKEMIEELERAAQQNLQYLLDASGQSMISRVKINKDYSIEVYNAYNQPFLANISQGQRQVLSLSFITALAQVAGGDSTLEMPLLMDTPFGRLSEMHQKNLIDYLPQICSQWVLLVTGREFGEEEKKKFEEFGVLGKFYELESQEAGMTVIREKQEIGGVKK